MDLKDYMYNIINKAKLWYMIYEKYLILDCHIHGVNMCIYIYHYIYVCIYKYVLCNDDMQWWYTVIVYAD